MACAFWHWLMHTPLRCWAFGVPPKLAVVRLRTCPRQVVMNEQTVVSCAGHPPGMLYVIITKVSAGTTTADDPGRRLGIQELRIWRDGEVLALQPHWAQRALGAARAPRAWRAGPSCCHATEATPSVDADG